MDATMLLCDSAEAVNGKLYILGAGWSQLLMPDFPTNMALAIKIAVPWDQANERHRVVVMLNDADGNPVELPGPEGNPVAVRNEAEFETGRPPGLMPGTELDAPLVFNFQGIPLPAGAYVWVLEVDGHPMARTPFRVGPVQRR